VCVCVCVYVCVCADPHPLSTNHKRTDLQAFARLGSAKQSLGLRARCTRATGRENAEVAIPNFLAVILGKHPGFSRNWRTSWGNVPRKLRSIWGETLS
jgi:hypothetical protein